jgi:hypothetical protein
MDLTAAIHRSSRASTAQEILGRDHPLALAEDRVRWLGTQSAALVAVLTGSAVASVAGMRAVLAVLLAAALVQAVLAIWLVSAVGSRRERALALLARGHDCLPLEAVRHELVRLANPRRATGLARSLDRLRSEARRPYRDRSIIAPLYVPAVIREVDDELARIVGLLRAAPQLVAVARAEQLLRGPSSPLYGTDSLRLREELRRIQFAG